ncbi:MAG: hypothetical protein ACREMF_06820 [Gemmatimonadales bacterium]
MRRHRLACSALILAGLVHPGRAHAQVLSPSGDPSPKAVFLDILKPMFEGGGLTFLTTIDELGVRWQLGELVLVGEFPLVHAKQKGATQGSTVIGNPYFGMATNPRGSFIGELGVRLPIASVSGDAFLAPSVGLIGDYTEFEAYFSDLLTIRGIAGYRFRKAGGLAVRTALRPTFVIPTSGGEPELFLDYAFQVGYEKDRAGLGAAINGRAIVTQNLSLGERTVHDLSLGAAVAFGRLRPGVLVRLPLENDLSQVLNASVGVKLEVAF